MSDFKERMKRIAERNEAMLEDFRNGLADIEVARKHKVSKGVAQTVRAAAKIAPARPPDDSGRPMHEFYPHIVRDLEDRCETKLTLQGIADKYGYALTTVERVLRSYENARRQAEEPSRKIAGCIYPVFHADRLNFIFGREAP